MKKSISPHDKNILRALAQKQLEYASLPVMHKRISEWYALNDLQGKRPIIQIELGTFAEEIISPLLQCEGETARGIEWALYQNILNYELFDDDYPVPEFFPIGWHTWFNLFNLTIDTQGAVDSSGNISVGFQYKHPINDLCADLPKLEKTTFGVDRDATYARKQFLEEIFGDILPVRIVSRGLSACPTYEAVKLLGMEYMYTAMYDCPDELHQLMKCITNSFIDYFKWQEDEGLLLPVNGRQHVGQGTWGFTRQLPGPDYFQYKEFDMTPGAQSLSPVTLSRYWGYLNSQESVGMSPYMYDEFIFPYYKSIAEMFGLLSYGCCEPPDKIWDSVSRYDNLRKLSIPPWSDEVQMGDLLRGTKIIYARKPDPNYLGVGSVFDEEGYTNHIVSTLKAAKGCNLEFTFRDIYTIGKDVKKARRAVEIVREQTEIHWG